MALVKVSSFGVPVSSTAAGEATLYHCAEMVGLPGHQAHLLLITSVPMLHMAPSPCSLAAAGAFSTS